MRLWSLFCARIYMEFRLLNQYLAATRNSFSRKRVHCMPITIGKHVVFKQSIDYCRNSIILRGQFFVYLCPTINIIFYCWPGYNPQNRIHKNSLSKLKYYHIIYMQIIANKNFFNLRSLLFFVVIFAPFCQCTWIVSNHESNSNSNSNKNQMNKMTAISK